MRSMIPAVVSSVRLTQICVMVATKQKASSGFPEEASCLVRSLQDTRSAPAAGPPGPPLGVVAVMMEVGRQAARLSPFMPRNAILGAALAACQAG